METGPEPTAPPHTPARCTDPRLQSPGSHCDPRTHPSFHRALALSLSHPRVPSGQSHPDETELLTPTPAPRLPCTRPRVCLPAFAHLQAVGNSLVWLRVPAGAGTCHPLGGFIHHVHTLGFLWGPREPARPSLLPQAAWLWLSGKTDLGPFVDSCVQPTKPGPSPSPFPFPRRVRPVRQEARGFLFVHEK